MLMCICKGFKANSGALEMVGTPKMRLMTKRINVLYHWFLKHVRNKRIRIYPISTKNQIADIYTKPLPLKLFLQHRWSILNK